MGCFSEKLIEDLRTYWLERWGEDISAEDAEQYLHALAELYLCMREIEENKR